MNDTLIYEARPNGLLPNRYYIRCPECEHFVINKWFTEHRVGHEFRRSTVELAAYFFERSKGLS